MAQPNAAPPANGCGEVVRIETHDRTTTRYTLGRGEGAPAQDARIALVLLVGGGGDINLDDQGCPRSLSRNVLMRMLPIFHGAGFVTALVDAPSDSIGGDGLAGFRIAPQHADDLGKVIADVRRRTNGSVWVMGHSRGTISAANAAARLSGPAAPEGLVLLSAMMSGDARARKAFVAQTVFDLPLEAIKTPVLVIGHAADNCVRSPAGLMGDITARTQGVREQFATVTGGPINPGRAPSLSACEVNEPHDYVDQQAEVAAGIARFIRGGSY
jgi:pimeloyl-ACP methyl ester carboxylesterase